VYKGANIYNCIVKQTLFNNFGVQTRNLHTYNKKTPSILLKGANCSSKPVSRVLFHYETVMISIINLALPLLTDSINLPILTIPINRDTETSSFAFRTYLVFQLLRFTAIPVARKSRELLPHVFTLTPIKTGAVYFLWYLLSPAAGAFPLGSRMLYVARTFLRLPDGRQR
jgi:hypothetical protein